MIQSLVLVAFLLSMLTPAFAYAQLVPESECMISGARPPVTMEMRDRAYRKAMRQEYPDMDEQDFEQHVQYGLAKQHGRMAAAQATCIRIKDKYPSLSRKEREILIQDELAKSEAAEEREERRVVGVPERPRMLSCTQMHFGAFSSIDCY